MMCAVTAGLCAVAPARHIVTVNSFSDTNLWTQSLQAAFLQVRGGRARGITINALPTPTLRFRLTLHVTVALLRAQCRVV